MISPGLFAYIKSQKWFFGVRADASLLFYSSKQDGVRKYVKGMQGIDWAETMLVPVDGQPVRAINVEQAKAFHEVSRKKVLENPQILADRIKENDALWLRIARECEALDQAVKAGDETAACQAFKTVAESYALHGVHFITIFSLGLKLTEAAKTSESEGPLALHDRWRNEVALKEELMGECWYDFLVYMAQRREVALTALDLMRFLSLSEVFAWLDGQALDADALVSSRMQQGFVYLDLHEERGVIDDAAFIAQISARFAAQDAMSDDSAELKGQTAFSNGAVVTGKVAVIKAKEELAEKAKDITGNILVAVQTTPHYIPYLKGVKAIVTDEGGITCHAAIVSREMQIPCVVGTKNATKILKDGDEVEVDAENGIVRLLISV